MITMATAYLTPRFNNFIPLIALLKDEVLKLRDEVKNLKQFFQSAEEETQKETSAQVKKDNEDIDLFFEDIGVLRCRNI